MARSGPRERGWHSWIEKKAAETSLGEDWVRNALWTKDRKILDDLESKWAFVAEYATMVRRVIAARERAATGTGSANQEEAEASVRVQTDEESNLLRREGDIWRIQYGGRPVSLRNTKGLAYIVHLIANQGIQVHASTLRELVSPPPGASGSSELESTPGVYLREDLGDAGDAIDAKALADYRKQIKALQARRAEAEDNHDLAQLELINRQIEAIQKELTSFC